MFTIKVKLIIHFFFKNSSDGKIVSLNYLYDSIILTTDIIKLKCFKNKAAKDFQIKEEILKHKNTCWEFLTSIEILNTEIHMQLIFTNPRATTLKKPNKKSSLFYPFHVNILLQIELVGKIVLEEEEKQCNCKSFNCKRWEGYGVIFEIEMFVLISSIRCRLLIETYGRYTMYMWLENPRDEWNLLASIGQNCDFFLFSTWSNQFLNLLNQLISLLWSF